MSSYELAADSTLDNNIDHNSPLEQGALQDGPVADALPFRDQTPGQQPLDYSDFFMSMRSELMYGTLGGASNAEDIIQEVAVGVWANWSRLQHSRRRTVAGYIRRAALNRRIDAHRALQARPQETTDQVLGYLPSWIAPKRAEWPR